MTLSALIAKVEAATAETQNKVLAEAINLAWQKHWIGDDQFSVAACFLQAGAYLDAARMLLPEGYMWQVRQNCPPDGEEIYCNAQVSPYCDPRDSDVPNYWANTNNDTPALALVSACLRAYEAKHD